MSPNEYRTICDKILTSTMQYINMETFRGHTIDRNAIPGGPIYAGAVADGAPVTLVYTPAGSGKSRLIQDRAAALVASGVTPPEILVLNMNIAKTNEMAAQLPGMTVMTFNDFVHGIFSANMPCIEPSDQDSVIGSLWLLDPDDPVKSAAASELIRKMSVRDPQEQNVILTLYLNTHLDVVVDLLSRIKKVDSALESMVTQNMMYRFSRDPYDARAILVNGVQNMPLPVLCTLLQYANMKKCSLFLTGSPSEAIYEFSMAYPNAMDTLSAYDGKGLHLIRLTERTNISPDIAAALDMDPYARIPAASVQALHLDGYGGMEYVLGAAIGPASQYLPSRLAARERVLILARSRQDVQDIRAFIEKTYRPAYPGLRVEDLSAAKYPSAVYGPVLARNYTRLRDSCGGGTIVMGRLFMELYNILSEDEQRTESPWAKRRAASAKNGLNQWVADHVPRFNGMDARLPLRQAIQLIVDIESADIQAGLKQAKTETGVGTGDADIVLSTVHSAIDVRMNHVIAVMRNTGGFPDDALYRVTLSRARKSELIVFANYRKSEPPYQKYLRTHIVPQP